MKRGFKYTICIVGLILVIVISTLVYQHISTKDGVSVLGYHNIVSDEEKETIFKDDRYSLSVSQLRKQLDYLKDNNYETLTMEEVQEYFEGKRAVSQKTVVLTFDDGYESFVTYVKPLMEEYSFHATCFVIGANIGFDNYLKQDQIIDTKNVSFYSHSYDMHHEAKGFNRKQIQDMSFDEISNDFKQNTVNSEYFAYPYGRFVKNIAEVMEDNGVQLAFSYNQYRHMTTNDKRYELPRYMVIDWWPYAYFKWIVA